MDYKYLKPFFLLFLLVFSYNVKGQVANGISTSLGNSPNQTICAGDSVTIALDQVSGVGQGYIIYRVRGGVTDTVKHNNATPTLTIANIQDGDIYYGERFDYDFSSTAILTSNITFTVLTLTGPSFTGGTIDQPNQFICSGFPGTNLSVTGGTVGIDYTLQWQRSIDAGTTYTDIPLATGETYNTGSVLVSTYFRRRVMHTGGGTCEQFSSVFIDEISDLDPGSLDTSIDTNICYDESPGTLGIGASVNPTASKGAITYQWQQNVNGGGWNDITTATNLTYTPPNLTQDTQFRRFAVNFDSITGSSCSFSTNVISIDVEVQINAVTGFINTETNDHLAPQISSINYIDLGTSFIVHNEVFIAGLSLRNLNQPNASFNKESAEKLPISISVQGGYEFDLNSYRQGLLPEFSFLYLYGAVTKFGNSIQVSLSQEAQLGSFSLGISQQASKLNTFSLTSVGLLVGVSVENFDFGLQYNIPIKQINQVFAPSIFELYVAFDFSIYRRNNRGRYKRLVTDNY
jgi:hypothetical protein